MNPKEKIGQLCHLYRSKLPNVETTWPHSIQNAVIFANQHLRDPILNVRKLKEVANMKNNNFSSTFRYYAGINPKDYILYHRIELAKILMSDPLLSNVPNADIAHAIGYTNEGSFSKAFKNIVGKSPREWRNNKFNT